jgi:hypothetical protein
LFSGKFKVAWVRSIMSRALVGTYGLDSRYFAIGQASPRSSPSPYNRNFGDEERNMRREIHLAKPGTRPLVLSSRRTCQGCRSSH